jgi:hypothetical protein
MTLTVPVAGTILVRLGKVGLALAELVIGGP